MTSTPYDDVFRTLLNDCSALIIPLVNEVFGEHYSGEEEIIFSPNGHFLNQQDGNMDERITDTCFQIRADRMKKYHLECQSNADNSMLVRFFEYDTQIVLDDGVVSGDTLTVVFPCSAVLFLRSNASTPDKMRIRMCTPGGDAGYDIQVMRAQAYTAAEIFRKKLLILLPFHIFSHEKKFAEYEKDAQAREALRREYGWIRDELEALLTSGVIDEYTKCMLIDMSNKVLVHIAKKFDRVKEEVRSVMGGKILEYEAKTIKNEGREEGIRGAVSILKEMGIPDQTILAKIREEYGLSQEESKKYI